MSTSNMIQGEVTEDNVQCVNEQVNEEEPICGKSSLSTTLGKCTLGEHDVNLGGQANSTDETMAIECETAETQAFTFEPKNSATQKALALPEIVEKILLSICWHQLFRFQGVNMTFKDVMASSPRLRQRMFIDPTPGKENETSVMRLVNPLVARIPVLRRLNWSYTAIGQTGPGQQKKVYGHTPPRTLFEGKRLAETSTKISRVVRDGKLNVSYVSEPEPSWHNTRVLASSNVRLMVFLNPDDYYDGVDYVGFNTEYEEFAPNAQLADVAAFVEMITTEWKRMVDEDLDTN